MRISAYTRLTKNQKTTAVGLAAAAGVTALTAGIAPGSDAGHGHSPAKPVAAQAAAAPGASAPKLPTSAHTGNKGPDGAPTKTFAQGGGTAPAPVSLAGGGHHEAKDVHDQQGRAEQQKRAQDVRGHKDAGRSAERPVRYGNNLDGWIKEARSIMKKKGIPGSYHGIKKNVMRESGGNPNIANDWDVNAKKGTPSKGLLQVIQPTFDQYHVKGTKDKITDPVANITAACNYAADKYGSMDHVDSAY